MADTPAHETMARAFEEAFGPAEGIALSAAPGRVNIIGEHTDYNGGFVMPMAIDRAVRLAFRGRRDRTVRLRSLDFGGETEFDLREISRDQAAPWSNYVRGVAHVMQAAGHELIGMDAVISGDVPQGAGLSSSAALEVACVMAFASAAGLQIEPVETIRLAQRAENQFVGVMCGIMDQFVSRLGEAGKALLLDCADLSYQLVPLDAARYAVVVADTGVKHELGATEYNARRAECESAARKLTGREDGTLRMVSREAFEERGPALTPSELRRSEHVLAENERVLAGRDALEGGDYAGFGRLMFASHESLRELFEVSCDELDAMVGAARASPGLIGARMTGGGFGGATVNLVEADSVGPFVDSLVAAYRDATGGEAKVFVFEPGPGASVQEF